MNVFLISIRYQDDSRVEDQYLAYTNEEDEEEVVDRVLCLPEFPSLELECIGTWSEEDDDEDEMYATPHAKNITENYEEWKDSSWFKSLPVLIDER